MKVAILASPVLAALLASATIPAVAQTQDSYRAVGTEPFWSLTIGKNAMTFKPMEGRATAVSKPRPVKTRNGEMYRARGMTVTITHRRCSDGMSDTAYRDTVKVTVGRRSFSGCGGDKNTAANAGANLLHGTEWRIDLIDGRHVRLPQPATVRFTATRIEGKICNAFGGRYSFTRGTLTTHEVVATQMACGGSLGETETAFFRAIAAPVRISQPGRDSLRLTSGRTSVTLRRSR